MFRFTRKQSSGSHNQYLAKNYPFGLKEIRRGRTVYPHTVQGTHASQVTICSHNTDNILYSLYVSTFNQVCNF